MFEGVPQVLMEGAGRLAGLKTQMASEQGRMRQAALDNFRNMMMQKYMFDKELEEKRKGRRQDLAMKGGSAAASLAGGLGGAAMQANAMKGLMGGMGGAGGALPAGFGLSGTDMATMGAFGGGGGLPLDQMLGMGPFG